MDRISTATKAPNLFGAGKHGFRDGDLAVGITPTDFNAAWFNGVQEELLALIGAAGIAPDAAVLNQLLTALRSAGVFLTPAQFDNTTKAATTAFVKTRGIEARGITAPAASGALDASVIGGTVCVNAAAATTQTLPAANSVAAGARIEFMNINTGVATVARAGADTIQMNSAAVTSVALGAGDTLVLESDGVSKWYAVQGSAQLGSAAAFASLLGSNGYQKLPGGLIVQWGRIGTGVSGSNSAPASGTVTFPIAFPTAALSVVVNANEPDSTGAAQARTGTISASQFSYQLFSVTGSASAGDGAYWIALGN